MEVLTNTATAEYVFEETQFTTDSSVAFERRKNMSCEFFTGCGCGGCCHFVKTTSISQSGSVMSLKIPARNLKNREKLCICLAQAIPVSTTPYNTTVSVTVGSVTLPLYTSCGNRVYADQLRSRRILHLNTATDVLSFTVSPKEICCTDHPFPTLTATA